MMDASLPTIERPRRFHFDWVPQVIFHPRPALARIAGQTTSVWLTPLLILTLAALLQVWVAGSIRQADALSGQMNLPPDFQYYPPEVQAQYMQAMSATSSPVFLFVFPAIMAFLRVWFGWMLVGGLIHLVLTLLGGRGSTGTAMNLVAWAGLPFALRELVRAAYMWNQHQLISTPGLSGFAPQGAGLALFASGLLALVDIYLIWHFILLLIGVRAGNSISLGKAVSGILIALLLVLGLQALLSYFGATLSGMTVIRPFF